MELRHLRYFLAVADYGSVAEAARRLHIVQPALSRQIRDLEEELGSDLFHRNAKGVQLTTAGAQFAIDARRVLNDVDSACERFVRIARGQSGALRIGLAPNYSWHPATLKPVHDFKLLIPMSRSCSNRRLPRSSSSRLPTVALTAVFSPGATRAIRRSRHVICSIAVSSSRCRVATESRCPLRRNG